MQFDLDQLRELLTILSQTDIAELTLKSGDFELTVRKGERGGQAIPPATQPRTATPSSSESSTLAIEKKGIEVVSPMVGTFYRSPTPDDLPFAELNDVISRGQTVCIIEAMKLMNEIEAEVDGRIIEILVQNGEPVEYGQPLMRILPGQG